MAAAEDDVTAGAEDVIVLDDLEGFFIEDDEEAIPAVKVYEAYANAVGEASANAEAWQLKVRQAVEEGDADALLQASVNVRLALAEFSGAAMMMSNLGLNPELKIEVEVSEDAEGQR